MCSSFAATETARRRLRPHARETLRRVEVEVSSADQRTQAEEALYAGHLPGGVRDQPLSAHEVDSVAGEVTQPRCEVPSVEAEADRTPGRVDPHRPVADRRRQRQALEAGDARSLRRRLGVVGQRSGDRVSDDDQQPDVT